MAKVLSKAWKTWNSGWLILSVRKFTSVTTFHLKVIRKGIVCTLHGYFFLVETDDSDSDDAQLERSPFEENVKEPTKDITSQEPECQVSSGEENDHPVAGTLEAASAHDDDIKA